MDVLVRVTAQFVDSEGKPKGFREFQFRADEDYMMFAADQDPFFIPTVQALIDEETKEWDDTYIYVDHKVIIYEPVELTKNFNEVNILLQRTLKSEI